MSDPAAAAFGAGRVYLLAVAGFADYFQPPNLHFDLYQIRKTGPWHPPGTDHRLATETP